MLIIVSTTIYYLLAQFCVAFLCSIPVLCFWSVIKLQCCNNILSLSVVCSLSGLVVLWWESRPTGSLNWLFKVIVPSACKKTWFFMKFHKGRLVSVNKLKSNLTQYYSQGCKEWKEILPRFGYFSPKIAIILLCWESM